MLLMACATQAAAVDDKGDTKRLPTQEFNFRIDDPDQKQVPITPPKAQWPTPVRRQITANTSTLAKRPPSTTNIAVACPTQVAPEMPRKAQQEGIESVVTAQIRIKGGVVQEVAIVSGHPIYDETVKAAMWQYKCISDPDGEVIATQQFWFKLE